MASNNCSNGQATCAVRTESQEVSVFLDEPSPRAADVARLRTTFAHVAASSAWLISRPIRVLRRGFALQRRVGVKPWLTASKSCSSGQVECKVC
eukprot:13048961-Heterocapsa_arctica.AAC.1